MKRNLTHLFLAIGALACSSASQATVVDFEGTIDSTGVAFYPLLTHNDYVITQGYYVGAISTKTGAIGGADLVGTMVNGSDLATGCGDLICPTNNTSNFLVALNDGLLDVQYTGVEAFKASGFDASFVAVAGDAIGSTALILQVEGYSTTAQVFSQQFAVPGPTAGAYSFTHFNLSAANAATPIVELAFRGFYCGTSTTCNRTSDKAQFAIDNLVLNAVPEPSQWLMLSLGLVAAGGMARRNVRRSA
jgi:hypothetical protein